MQVEPEQVRQVAVASPCTANWDEMKGDENVRHCDHCRKDVYNLSSMSLEDVAQLIARKEGRVCVRFYRRADGTLLTDDCPKGLAAVRRRLAVVAGMVVSACAFLYGNLVSATCRLTGRETPASSAPARTVDVAFRGPPTSVAPPPASPAMPAPEPAASAIAQPVIDPFKPQATVKDGPHCNVTMGELAPLTPPAPPVNFKIEGIAGRPGQYLATIEFEGQSRVVAEGAMIPPGANPAFQVKQITADAVTVHDRRINRLVKKLLLGL